MLPTTSGGWTIGVFDSGIGGLTVLSELIEQFPNEDFIYVGDTLNCPYGIKTKDEIASLVSRVATYLINQNVKAIVIACNTATANSGHLCKMTNIPIIGVIEPTAECAANATKNKKVAVLATNATIDSNCYQNLLTEKINSNNTKLYPVKCSEFVPAIESGQIENDYSFNLVKSKLQSLVNEGIDTVILGCTHFPLYRAEISSVLKNSNLITSGKPTGEYLKKVLMKNQLLNDQNINGKVIINTTGEPEKMKEQISWFSKKYQGINKIDI
jgi:glutamate racemase